MLHERKWRRRLILNFVTLIVWMLISAAILFFTSSNPQQSTGGLLVAVSVLIIVIYYLANKRIMDLNWNLNNRTLSAARRLLWFMYPLFAFYVFIAFRLLGSDYIMNNGAQMTTGVGIYGTILLIITLGIIFNRWHMAFKSLKHEMK